MPDIYLRNIQEVFNDQGQELAQTSALSGGVVTDVVAAKAGRRIKVIAATIYVQPPGGTDAIFSFRVGASSTNYFRQMTPDNIRISKFFNFGPSGWVLAPNTKLAATLSRVGSSGDITVLYKYIE